MPVDKAIVSVVTELAGYKLADYLAEPKLFANETGRDPLSDTDAGKLCARVMPTLEKAMETANRTKRFDAIPADQQVEEIKRIAESAAIDTANKIIREVADGAGFTTMREWSNPTAGDQAYAATRIRELAEQRDTLEAGAERFIAGHSSTPRGHFKRR